MSQLIRDEKPFFFPPFHPHCRCTVVAVKANGEDFPVGEQNYSEESSTTFYDVDNNFRITPQQNVMFVEQIDSPETAQIYFTRQHGIHFDLGAVKTSNWKDFAEEYDQSLKEVYDLVGKEYLGTLKNIMFTEASEELKYAIGWTTESGSKVTMNTDYLAKKKFNKVVSENIKNGVYSAFATKDAKKYVFNHELGHVVYANLDEEQRSQIADLFYSKLNTDLPISKIAMQNPNEFFAEYIGLFSNPENRKQLENFPDSKRAQVFQQIMTIIGK